MSGVILGQKIDQSQGFDDKGKRIAMTHISTSPCYLIDVKTGRDNVIVLKLGFGAVKQIKNPQKGELAKAGIKAPLRFFREHNFSISDDSVKLIEEDNKRGFKFGETKLLQGDEITPIKLFKKDEKVDVIGTSKGKGFQGVVKRHRFSGGPKTHGQSDRLRAPGSIGQTTTPGRVYKGKRMAGRMGGNRVTVKGLKVVEVTDRGLTIKGLVPGAKKGLLQIRSAL